MSYSIKVVLNNNKDKDGLQKIQIRVTYNRMLSYHQTDFKVKYTDFNNEVTAHPQKKTINIHLRTLVNEIEGRMIEAINGRRTIDRATLNALVSGDKINTGLFAGFVEDCKTKYRWKFSKGTIAHYGVVSGKIENYKKGTTLSHMDIRFLQDFEAHLRLESLDGNTVQDNMKTLKGLLNKAAEIGLIDQKQFGRYRVPKYVQKIPEYLTEVETDKIYEYVKDLKRKGVQRAGYYFLLACYAGCRISDACRFNYDQMVKGDTVLFQAGKNKKIVAIPIYPRLQKVLDFVKDNPVDLEQAVINRYIKEICLDLEINKHVKFHTARTSFAMMLMANGFSLDEVAEMLGDTVKVAKIYARITNEHLRGKVRERLG